MGLGESDAHRGTHRRAIAVKHVGIFRGIEGAARAASGGIRKDILLVLSVNGSRFVEAFLLTKMEVIQVCLLLLEDTPQATVVADKRRPDVPSRLGHIPLHIFIASRS